MYSIYLYIINVEPCTMLKYKRIRTNIYLCTVLLIKPLYPCFTMYIIACSTLNTVHCRLYCKLYSVFITVHFTL